MGRNLSSLKVPQEQKSETIKLIHIPHQDIIAYLEGRLSPTRKAAIAQAIQHPFYQDVIAGTKAMLEDHEEFETYQDVSDYLESSRLESLEHLQNTCSCF